MNNHTYRGVQALRGLAALGVMFFHFRWNINIVTPGLGDKLFGWGATGVDLFFIISGFVITLSAARAPGGTQGALNFLRNRAYRIFPAYYVILVISFFLSGAMSIFHYADKTENIISALTFLPIDAEHAPFYVDDNGLYGVRWTLNYELFFYIVISLSLLFKKRWVMAGLFFLFSLVLLPLLLWHQFTLDTSGYAVSRALTGLITNPIIWLFLAGMTLGLALPHLGWVPPKVMTMFALVSLMGCFYLFTQGLFIGHGILNSGWIYIIILLGVVLSESVTGKYIPRFFVWLGEISFSLYLIHTLMNNGIGKRFESIGISDGYPRLVCSILLSLLLAGLSWHYIEKPLINFSKRNKSRFHVVSVK